MDNNLKLLQAELVDLYKRIDSVFSRNKIRFFAIYGTCMGAIRHKGIIPWDDDIDLAVFREDFDDALKHLNAEGFELIAGTAETIPGCPKYYGRVFNRIAHRSSQERRHAFVDVFVIEKADEAKLFFLMRALFCVGLGRIVDRRNGCVGNAHPLLYALLDVVMFPFRMFTSNFIKRFRRKVYLGANGNRYIRITGGLTLRRHLAKEFDAALRVPFYDTTIPVPIGYDTFLTRCYGDWRTPPPVELRVGNAINESGDWNVQLPKDEERMV